MMLSRFIHEVLRYSMCNFHVSIGPLKCKPRKVCSRLKGTEVVFIVIVGKEGRVRLRVKNMRAHF